MSRVYTKLNLDKRLLLSIWIQHHPIIVGIGTIRFSGKLWRMVRRGRVLWCFSAQIGIDKDFWSLFLFANFYE